MHNLFFDMRARVLAVGAILLFATLALQQRDMFERVSAKYRHVIFLSAVIVSIGLIASGLTLLVLTM